MRPKDSAGPVEDFKTAARTEIERKFNVRIIANVGDQDSDLIGGHAERTFKVPNPFYFIP
jgi:acid phosphatase